MATSDNSMFFLEKSVQILAVHGWNRLSSPWILVDVWKNCVADYTAGYDFCIGEFDNDISVRKAIELLLNNKELIATDAGSHFREQIHETDEKFKKILLPQTRPDRIHWWKKGILRYSGNEYASDIKKLFNVNFEIIDN